VAFALPGSVDVDVEIVVAIGNYSVDVNAQDTDALFLPDAMHTIAQHLEQVLKLPAVRKAMSTPIKVDDVD
jgi:hypothetical protein